jgi:hypothetical protein
LAPTKNGVDINIRIEELLKELRDTQREHLAEYRNVTRKSLELQLKALSRQEAIVVLYRRIVLIGGTVATGLLGLLIFLLTRWSRYLFR